MKVACVGGEPTGLYFALLMKLRDPGHDITIFERSVDTSTYGWGVTLEGDLLETLYRSDPESARAIDQAAFRWVNHVVDVQGEQVLDAGRGGCSIGGSVCWISWPAGPGALVCISSSIRR